MEEKKESKALEICALVFGILSIVTCCCCFGIWGIVGLILSIIALVKGRKSGLTIVGLICSIVGLLGSLIIVFYMVSPAGDVFVEEFKQGFKEGFESTYNNSDLDSETEDDDVKVYEAPLDREKDLQEMQNKYVAGKGYDEVSVAGTKITLPCKFSDFKADFTYDLGEDVAFTEEEWKNCEDDTIYGYDKEGNRAFGFWVPENTMWNELDEADVYSLYASKYTGLTPKNVEFFEGIKIGMSVDEVLKKLDKFLYELNDDDEGYVVIDCYFDGDKCIHYSFYFQDDELYDMYVVAY